MALDAEVLGALNEDERNRYELEAKRLGTSLVHEVLLDEANRRGFLAVQSSRDPFPLKNGNLPLSDEELVIGLCGPASVKEGRTLILAFQIIARGKINWSRLSQKAREHGVAGILKWLATRTVTPRTAALLFQLRGEETADINIHADRFRKPYLRPLPV